MKLKEFQLNAVNQLFEKMEGSARDIIFKSPTGSGKTIILTYFMHQYLLSFPNIVFVWLTPGKGNLEEQSKAKMDKYIHNAKTKLLADVMTSGFEENDCCFINWEKLTKKGNNALKDSERANFLDHINHALNNNLRFVVIIDESHSNDTVKSDEIIQYFKTDKIIRCSATPILLKNAEVIEIPEADVIASGLIKKMIIINEDFPQEASANDQVSFLLEKAYAKQRDLRLVYLKLGKDINPLIIVQVPNKSEILEDNVERWFESQGIAFENKQLAIWLSDRHENLEGIEKNDADSIAVIIKQAIATGWDCPRAQILVKLRDNMDERFEIQTIGRIRRMPEAKHYGSDLLDSCYLYTFDEKYTTSVKDSLGKEALDAQTIYLKNEYKNVTLTSEQRTSVVSGQDPNKALKAIKEYYRLEYGIENKDDAETKLKYHGYDFSKDVIKHTYSGESATVFFDSENMNKIALRETLNTHKHGRDRHHEVGRIGREIGIEYSFMNTIINRLFAKDSKYKDRILNLDTRDVYAFIINNSDRLRRDFRSAMASEATQSKLDLKNITKVDFRIPQSCLFTFDRSSKSQEIMSKNVYQNYLSSAEPRSSVEKKFEKYCEANGRVRWFYKNGDKGNEYLSIVYSDNSGKQKNFYPDYVLCVNDEIWIIETKGGFDRRGNSQDIDIYSPKKFEVLKDYLIRYNLKGGIVRYDDKSQELVICTDNFYDDISSEVWQMLKILI